MSKTIKVVNDKGRPFIVRLVEKGDNYGLGFSLTHDGEEPLVEFYDYSQDKQKFTEYGQFVSRYYLRTILDRKRGTGLWLDGGSEEWIVSGDNMDEVEEWLRRR